MLELNKIYNIDCLEGLKQLDDNSIDSIVTDPPYELGFMGKEWDKTGIAYNVELWRQCLRVLKPGGHMLVAGIGRTHHRVMCAIEDAGFEIRDCIYHIFGSGFPKSLDISKAIDKELDKLNERPIVQIIRKTPPATQGIYGDYGKDYELKITIPATSEAQKWQGWGTGLKPAAEIWILARKPISEKNVALNVLKWGTGGINIDGCRIPHNEECKPMKAQKDKNIMSGGGKYQQAGRHKDTLELKPNGRFPANVIFDEEAAKMLDEQSNNASRFFYCAKASKKERGEFNNHPTVKPLKLIEYLIKLVTPPNGICLDPFEGSGTHAVVCERLGFNYIGFEINPEYCEIAEKRLQMFRSDAK